MSSYLFYDIETTGLNPAFDQILEFAAIRTDMTLKEIDRLVMSIRLRPDIIPSPKAFLTHGIGISEARSGLCEYEAITQIHKWFNKPGTISVGYNILDFDDVFLRFSFYRNLLPPYTHQYANGCMRLDLFPLTILYWLYRPEVLNWPDINGKTSLKLEHINAGNRLSIGPAHEALTDAKAALALGSRLIAQKDMWDYVSGYFHKTTDNLRMNKLPVAFKSPTGPHRKALMIGGEFGQSRQFQAPVLSIGSSIPYSNQTLWLRLDLEELKNTTADQIAESTWTVRKKSGESGLLLPPLERYWNRLSVERRRLADENLRWLDSNQDLFQEIISYHRNYRYPEIPDVDADASLYKVGFLSSPEQKLCRRFHEAAPKQKAEWINRFSGIEQQELATRVLYRNYPSHFSGKPPALFSRFVDRINPKSNEAALVDYKGERRTTPIAALSEIKQLRHLEDLTPEKRNLLSDLERYIRERYKIEENPS